MGRSRLQLVCTTFIVHAINRHLATWHLQRKRYRRDCQVPCQDFRSFAISAKSNYPFKESCSWKILKLHSYCNEMWRNWANYFMRRKKSLASEREGNNRLVIASRRQAAQTAEKNVRIRVVEKREKKVFHSTGALPNEGVHFFIRSSSRRRS